MDAKDHYEKPPTSTRNASTSTMDGSITNVKFRIIQMVKSFFNNLTGEQWRLLSSCSPDATTKLLMADLILEIVTILSKAFRSEVEVSQEDVGDRLGEIVKDCLKTALDITDDVQCESSRRFQDMLNIEVSLNIKSFYSSPGKSGVSLHITRPQILDAMVRSFIQMMYNFAARVKKIFTCRGQKRVSLMEEAQSSNKIIQNELNGMIVPLVSEMSDSQYDNFQSISCLEETVVKDIIQELQEPEHTVTKGGKLKNFLQKQFAKMWLNRIWIQLMKKYHKHPPESPITLAEIPDLFPRAMLLKPVPRAAALILTKRLTSFLFKRMTGEDFALFPRGTDGTSRALQSGVDIYWDIWDKVWNFQGLLEWWQNTQVDIMVKRLGQALQKNELKKLEETGRKSEGGIFKKAIRSTKAFFNSCGVRLQECYNAEVEEFMSGYISTEEETSSTITESPMVHTQDSILSTEAEPSLEEIKKCFFETIVEKLVSEILLKINVYLTQVEPSDIIHHLFEMTWPEVDGINFEVTKKTVKILEKNLLNDLCKILGSVDMVYCALVQKDEALRKHIALSFKRHLSPPTEKSSSVAEFFSSVGRGAANIYGRKNRVDPTQD